MKEEICLWSLELAFSVQQFGCRTFQRGFALV